MGAWLPRFGSLPYLRLMEPTDEPAGLPADIIQIMDYIGQMRASYGHVKWNEQAKLKASMMNEWRRWARVDPAALALRCNEVGLNGEETSEILDWLERRKQGRRLVPDSSYKTFKFGVPHVEAERLQPKTSGDW